jgi:lipopolysaccharide export LptBFGC system permease protein LptF
MTRCFAGRWTAALAALATCFSYYWLIWTGRAAALESTLPAFAGAWLPVAVFAVVSVALLKVASLPRDRLAHDNHRRAR